MFLDHLSQTHNVKGHLAPSQKEWVSLQGESTTPWKPLSRKFLPTRNLQPHFDSQGTWTFEKGRREPNQMSTTQAHPRADPPQKWISSALPQVGQLLYLRWQLDQKREQDADEKWVRGQNSAVSLTPHPPFPFRNNLYTATQLWLCPRMCSF